MSSTTSISIGVILCSSRKPRVNPQVTEFVTETFKQWISSSNNPSNVELNLIDLAAWNLPLFDESGIPAEIHETEAYDHEHTKAWSREIQKHTALIFVSPQYNWGIPGVLKNAIDFLFNEWVKKPGMIVTYGGHGGNKCSSQLREVLAGGVRMQLVETAPTFAFPSKQVLFDAAKGKDINATGENSIWNAQRQILHQGFEELMTLVNKNQ